MRDFIHLFIIILVYVQQNVVSEKKNPVIRLVTDYLRKYTGLNNLIDDQLYIYFPRPLVTNLINNNSMTANEALLTLVSASKTDAVGSSDPEFYRCLHYLKFI